MELNAHDKKRFYVLLDVGGTQVKGCMLDEDGNRSGELRSYPAYARKSAGEVMDNFAYIINDLMKQEPEAGVLGVGMAFPGPFDYERGISLMKGLDKYDSIYNMVIEPELKKRIPQLEDAKFSFLHDIEAFALGISWFGNASHEHKICCLCIGTGAGSAFLENKIPQKSGSGVPEHGWVYHLPYRDSIIDDYLSVRGLEKISRTVFGQPKSGKELWELTQSGDERAVRVWELFGGDLTEAMIPVLEEFKPNAVVLGGQISKSFSYFGKAFSKECDRRSINIYVETETSEKAIQGLYVKMAKDKIC